MCLLKAFCNLGHDCTVATVQLTDSYLTSTLPFVQTTSTQISVSAFASDIFTSNSAAVTLSGTSVPTMTAILLSFCQSGTQWNGHCAKFLRCQWTARPNCCACNVSSCPTIPALDMTAPLPLFDSLTHMTSDFNIASPGRSGATYEPKATLVKDELVAKTLSKAAKVTLPITLL